jgi:adenylylsulfate kinase
MKNLTTEDLKISKDKRAEAKNQTPLVIWFTGFSGSGKSTLAKELDAKLHKLGYHTYVLDGDNLRLGLNKDLTFSPEDRSENIRRVAELSKLFTDAGLIVITSFISPYKSDRLLAKSIIGEENFYEIYLSTPIEVCEKRDAKGLYKKARAHEILNFTGISAPYEVPQQSALNINTDNYTISESVNIIKEEILRKISI